MKNTLRLLQARRSAERGLPLVALLAIASTSLVLPTFMEQVATAARRPPVKLRITIKEAGTGRKVAPGVVLYRVVRKSGGYDSGWQSYPGSTVQLTIRRRGWYQISVMGGTKYKDQAVRRKIVDQPNRGNVFPVSIKMRKR